MKRGSHSQRATPGEVAFLIGFIAFGLVVFAVGLCL